MVGGRKRPGDWQCAKPTLEGTVFWKRQKKTEAAGGFSEVTRETELRHSSLLQPGLLTSSDTSLAGPLGWCIPLRWTPVAGGLCLRPHPTFLLQLTCTVLSWKLPSPLPCGGPGPPCPMDRRLCFVPDLQELPIETAAPSRGRFRKLLRITSSPIRS